MKRVYKILLPAFVFALLLGGCKNAQTPAAPTESGTVTAVEAASNLTESADSSETGTTKAGETTTKSAATKPGETTTKQAVTKPGEATTKPATTKVSSTQNGITAAKPATTKPGQTTTKPATTKPTTTKPATTKPGGTSPVVTTKPGETTTVPVAAGNRISGRITYLNEAPVYADKVTAAKLRQFGLPADKQKDILANPDEYVFYSLDILLENKEAIPVTLYQLDIADNGKDGIYINGDTSGDIGLPVGGKITNRFFIVAPVDASDGQVLSTLRTMNLRIKYAATLEDDDATPAYVYSKIG